MRSAAPPPQQIAPPPVRLWVAGITKMGAALPYPVWQKHRSLLEAESCPVAICPSSVRQERVFMPQAEHPRAALISPLVRQEVRRLPARAVFLPEVQMCRRLQQELPVRQAAVLPRPDILRPAQQEQYHLPDRSGLSLDAVRFRPEQQERADPAVWRKSGRRGVHLRPQQQEQFRKGLQRRPK